MKKLLWLTPFVACGLACAVRTTNSTAKASDTAPPIPLASAPEPVSDSKPTWQERIKAQNKALMEGLQGKLQILSLPASPRVANRRLTAMVYLPPGYDAPENARKRYPVAYILHGAPGGVRDPFVNAGVHRVAEELITSHRMQPAILVGWDGSGPKGVDDIVDYLDRKDGYQEESFVLQDLVPWVDAQYRTIAKPEARALVGFSAGGYGAANLGLKHPDTFRVLVSHAGFFDPGDDEKNMTEILGPKSALWDANSPIERVRELSAGTRLHFYMDCGKDDELLREFKNMKRELRAKRVDFEAQVVSGAHDWAYLHDHYFDSLLFCDRRWKEMGIKTE